MASATPGKSLAALRGTIRDTLEVISLRTSVRRIAPIVRLLDGYLISRRNVLPVVDDVDVSTGKPKGGKNKAGAKGSGAASGAAESEAIAASGDRKGEKAAPSSDGKGAAAPKPAPATHKRILLCPEKVTGLDLAGLPATLRDTVLAADPATGEPGCEPLKHSRVLGYDDLTYDEVLRRWLPEDVPIPFSYETVGHIAHMNLRDCHWPHSRLIGEVLLDKVPALRTVVSKRGVIESKFRTFPMEVLAGADSTEALVTEQGCRFKFDFREVYWNSRLGTEHARLVSLFAAGEVVCDVFAGVGPFAIPAAKRAGCVVHANDLNPESHRWLVANASLNAVPSGRLTTYNTDGATFIRDSVPGADPDHVVMNLPASSLDFVAGLRAAGLRNSCRIHVYTFAVAPADAGPVQRFDYGAEAVRCLREKLGPGPEIERVSCHDVRDVAPNKHMVCVSFSFAESGSRDVGHPQRSADDGQEPPAKRPRS